jgi:hypothetical protein
LRPPSAKQDGPAGVAQTEALVCVRRHGDDREQAQKRYGGGQFLHLCHSMRM